MTEDSPQPHEQQDKNQTVTKNQRPAFLIPKSFFTPWRQLSLALLQSHFCPKSVYSGHRGRRSLRAQPGQLSNALGCDLCWHPG